MSKRRKQPTSKERLAAALLQILEYRLGREFTHQEREELRAKSAAEIIAEFECDHTVFVALGGDNHPVNLCWRTKPEHREKTAKVDQPAIAKTRRLSPDQVACREQLLAISAPESLTAEREQEPRSCWPQGRKIPSRPFPKREKA